MPVPPASTAMQRASWRTPAVILVCGALILLLSFGVRTAFGLFLQQCKFGLNGSQL